MSYENERVCSTENEKLMWKKGEKIENFTLEYFGLDRLKILCINSQSTLFKFDVFVIC